MAFWLYKKIRDKQQQNASLGPWTELHQLEGCGIPSTRDQDLAGRQSSREHAIDEEQMVTTNEEMKAARQYRWRLIAGIFIPASVQALNVTMIAGALPFIASDFSGLTNSSGHVNDY